MARYFELRGFPGYFAPAIVAALAFVLMYRGNSWKPSVISVAIQKRIKEHGKLWTSAFVAVYGLIFAGAGIRELWKEHLNFVNTKAAFNAVMVDLEFHRHAIVTTDPVFSNTIYLLQAFDIYRHAQRGAPCVIKITAPRGLGERMASMVAQLSNSVSDCFTFGPDMNFDMNPELEKEANEGMVVDAIVFHASRDDKAAEQLFIQLGNQVRLVRSYALPAKASYQLPSDKTNASVVWLQFGTNVKWNSELH